MKPFLLIRAMGVGFVIVALSVAMPSCSQHQDSHASLQPPFIGGWRLAWLEEPGADGTVHRVDCSGQLVFTRDGRMSVQVMYLNPQPDPHAGPVQYAQGGYEASFGRYEIDERSHRFTYHVEGALVRTLVGKDLLRAYELSGTQLIIKSPSPDEHWRVAWEHAGGAQFARIKPEDGHKKETP